MFAATVLSFSIATTSAFVTIFLADLISICCGFGVGAGVGVFVGFFVGSGDGVFVGVFVGTGVGVFVGTMVGVSVGAFVGVGVAVGAIVGVGAGVPDAPPAYAFTQTFAATAVFASFHDVPFVLM